MPELDAQKLCSKYSIPCPPTKVGKSKDECGEICESLGFPVVMKILSRQIVHKSDVGGVIIGIKDPTELGKAFDKMAADVKAACPNAKIDGYVIQKMMPAGIEVVVGALRNPQFGPVVMFGMGGIYIEVFKDVEFRLAPLDKAEACRQIMDTKICKILKGVRGQKPCDIDALAALVVHVGKMICELEEIHEIDLNPVFSYHDGCMAVDARIVVGK
jgi:acetyl-CoA synthetase (ADP-forming)